MGALTPWKPRQELEKLQRNMEEMFERLSGRFFGHREENRSFWGGEPWSPAIESRTENGNLIVKADLPGIDPKEISISIAGDRLTVEGERKHEEKKEEKDYFYREVEYGKFSRTIPLPEGVNADQVKASYKNGVLEITMPTPQQTESKKVQVEVH